VEVGWSLFTGEEVTTSVAKATDTHHILFKKMDFACCNYLDLLLFQCYDEKGICTSFSSIYMEGRNFVMMQNRSQSSKKKISPAQRERMLWEASRRYMRGSITDDELRNIERSISTKSASSDLESQPGQGN